MPPEVYEKNLAWLRAHAAALVGDAAVNLPLLRLMLKERCLPLDAARRLVDRLSRANQPELTLELLHYVQGDTASDDELW